MSLGTQVAEVLALLRLQLADLTVLLCPHLSRLRPIESAGVLGRLIAFGHGRLIT